MVKKWRSCLSLLVSFAFILSMLFLDTYEVKAFTAVDYVLNNLTWSGSFNFGNEYSNEVSGTISGVSGGGGYIHDGSGSISSVSGGSGSIRSYTTQYREGGTYHVSLPLTVEGSYPYSDYSDTDYVKVLTLFANFTSARGTLSKVSIYRFDGNFIGTVGDGSSYTSSYTLPASDVFLYVDGVNYGYRGLFRLEFDVTYDNSVSGSTINDTFTLGYLRNYISPTGRTTNDAITVYDSSANQSLTSIEQNEQSINDSVSNPSGGGILGTIKNFFGGFFGWLHDTILGLFVPSSDYFTTWFTNVNTLLSDKLGMLYAPLDLLISTLNAVYSASSDFTGIPFPEIKWGDTVLVSAQNLTFSNLLGEHFEDIQGYVYFGTDVVLLFAFLMLLQRKITLVLRGHESG